jgi:hypothetical protein
VPSLGWLPVVADADARVARIRCVGRSRVELGADLGTALRPVAVGRLAHRGVALEPRAEGARDRRERARQPGEAGVVGAGLDASELDSQARRASSATPAGRPIAAESTSASMTISAPASASANSAA